MRSHVICSVAAVFAAFMQFATVFAVFAQPLPAIAAQPAGAMATLSATRGILQVTVEARRAI
jgi:hypothetical protein